MSRAGLRALPFRAATHDSAKQAMLERAATLPALSGLQVRGDSDLTVALIDSWAAVVDVLCFYQERIINEAFLRTCVERDSLAHLAALVGYQLRPGLAASTTLSFTCEAAGGMRPDAPVIVDVGTKVQSLPGPGESPQTFETVDVLDGRANWSAIRPHLFVPQPVTAQTSSIVVDGISTRVRPGDCILLVIDGVPNARLATDVQVDTVAQTTTIALTDADRRDVPREEPPPPAAAREAPPATPMRDVHALAHLAGTDVGSVVRQLASLEPPKANVAVYALRSRAALFGANAPDWRSMPKTMREAHGDSSEIPQGDWPFSYPFVIGSTALYLDTLHPQVMPKSWIVVAWPDAAPLCALLTRVDEAAVSGFAMSAKVTRLSFDATLGTLNAPSSTADVRGSTVYLQSEELTLKETIREPDSDTTYVAGNEIELDGFYPDLDSDRTIYIGGLTESGERGGESATIEAAGLVQGGRTRIRLCASLALRYRKSSVTINANVVRATHGETVSDILGSGDAGQAFQRFRLRQGPLTFLSDEGGRGHRAQLTIWVNDIVYQYVPSFAGCGPHDHVYTIGFEPGGEAYVEFGDGIAGSRVRTGVENVRATYRRGIGLAGSLGPGKLTMLLRQPLGVRGVTNPLATTGAADAESTENVRRNLGSAATILHRLVSLSDYQAFSNAYAGVGKALAEWLLVDGRRTIVVTIAPSDASIAHEGLLPSLEQTLRMQGDLYVPLATVWHRRASFRFSPKIKIDADYRESLVVKEVRHALLEAFGFEHRDLAQAATVSQVLAAIHRVPGVVAATVDHLRRSEETSNDFVIGFHTRPYARRADSDTGGRLFANRARMDEDSGLLGAELLTVDPASLADIGVWS